MPKRTVTGLWLLILMAAGTIVGDGAEAQSVKDRVPGLGQLKADVGAWAEYVHQSAGSRTVPLRLSLVGRDSDAYWHEVSTVVNGVKNVLKLLVTGKSVDIENVRKIILKNGSNPAIEMPAGALGAVGGLMLFGPMLGLGQTGGIPSLDGFTDRGPEEVVVKAGRLKAHRYRLTRQEGNYDVWISDAVPLWGLARVVFPGGQMELLKYGGGAVSQITERPQKLQLPFLVKPGERPRD
jgi:hypothetical protein